MIVPSAAGSGQDILARIAAQRLAEIRGQGVVVENRFGAAGVLGSDLIAKAAPDGDAIGVANSSSMAIAPAPLPGVPFDPMTSVTPLGLAAANDCALAVRPALRGERLARLRGAGLCACGVRFNRGRRRAENCSPYRHSSRRW